MTQMVNVPTKTEALLPSVYAEYIHVTRYARFRDDLKRRETWPESVERYITFISNVATKQGSPLDDETIGWLRNSILNTRAMCSMRALMTAGPAAERDNLAIYNCTAIAVDDVRTFDETMYLLMCGTGVGFSVERQHISKLPSIPETFFPVADTIVIDDSRRAWASGYRRLLASLWTGHLPEWDLSRLRPAGARLKTFGGRSSGPEPLDRLFRYTIEVFKGAAGRKLTSVECHGLMCKIGEIVVSGGVRRSAMISLSNPSDERMRDAKSGEWGTTAPHYRMANNSAVWTEKPDPGRFLDEWTALYRSKSGERGIVNRAAFQKQAARNGRRDAEREFLTNPCGEILLRPAQCCNLTEIVVRADDTLDDLKDKARAATVMGTLQACCTDFTYVRPIWRQNCEEERLLGVSITGQMDHPMIAGTSPESARWLNELRQVCVDTNAEWAEKLDIAPSAAITCQKPSGTVSQLVDSASGGHERFAPFYIRRTRDLKNDPISEIVRMAGVPCETDVMTPDNWVFEWPTRAPTLPPRLSAVEQCERWLHTKRHWCEHNPSATILVNEDEWIAVGAFVYEYFDEIGGLSFLPRTNHIYAQAPYEEITEAEYERRLADMPRMIDWSLLSALESEDNTTGSQELACVAGECEL